MLNTGGNIKNEAINVSLLTREEMPLEGWSRAIGVRLAHPAPDRLYFIVTIMTTGDLDKRYFLRRGFPEARGALGGQVGAPRAANGI